MSFVEQLARDTQALLGPGSEFAEAIIYTPHGESPRTIYAIVDRNPQERYGETQQGIGDDVAVIVSRADVPSVNRDGDTVAVRPNLGGPVRAYTVRQILRQDEALFVLRVR